MILEIDGGTRGIRKGYIPLVVIYTVDPDSEKPLCICGEDITYIL